MGGQLAQTMAMDNGKKIKRLYKEIDELKKENIDLKYRVIHLETEVKGLKFD
ncbi:MAG: hypothetical protein ACQEQF_00540 [Bacillota bacterium]